MLTHFFKGSLLLFTLLILPGGYPLSAQNPALPDELQRLGEDLTAARGDSATIARLLAEVKLEVDRIGSDQAAAFLIESRVRSLRTSYSPEESNEMLLPVMTIYERIGDHAGRARLHNLFGSIAYEKRDFLTVYQHAEQQLLAAREANDRQEIGRALGNLALSSKLTGNKAQARAYYLEGIEHASQAGDSTSMIKTYYNLSNLHPGSDPEQLDSAMTYLYQALALSRQTDKEEHGFLGIMNEGMAMAHARSGDLDSAAVYAVASLKENTLANDPAGIFRSTRYLGKTYYRQGKMKQSAELFYQALSLLPTAASADPSALYRDLGNYYQKLGDADSTARYLHLAIVAEREDAKKTRAANIARLETQFRTREQKAEIARLDEEDAMNQSRIKLQRIALAGFATLLLVLGVLAYRLFRQRQRIASQHETISTALRDKETLMKEIHHRVKNNLQMISSLLALQGEFVEDDAALDALKMGQSRVRSMGIIHQKLYLRDETVTDVNARDYLDQLIGELMATLNVHGLPLRLEKTIEDIDLDIDRMIPLGLIANEVITNSMKYAFTGRESGKLSVSFQKIGEEFELLIADDGGGVGEELKENNGSFGSLLIRTFAEQLEGRLRVESEGGTAVRLVFPV